MKDVLDRPNRGILGGCVGESQEHQCRHAEDAWVPLNQRKSAEANWRLPFVSVARSAVPIHFHALVMAVIHPPVRPGPEGLSATFLNFFPAIFLYIQIFFKQTGSIFSFFFYFFPQQ